MIYRSESEATRRIFHLAQTLGVWPGYFYSPVAGGWVLTYDPRPDSPAGYKGEVLI